MPGGAGEGAQAGWGEEAEAGWGEGAEGGGEAEYDMWDIRGSGESMLLSIGFYTLQQVK